MTIRKTMILFMLCLSLWACEEEIVEIEVEKVEAWNMREDFTGRNKIKLNSLATEDNLYLYGPDFFSILNSQNEVTHFLNRLRYPNFSRLPISNNYYLEANSEILRFGNLTNPVGNSTVINFANLAPDFDSFNFGSLYQPGVFAINDLGQCLIPINSTDPAHPIVAYLFQTQVQDGFTQVVDTIRVEIPVANAGLFFAQGFEDYFILSADRNVYKIYADGSSKVVINQPVFNIFKYQDRLFGLQDDTRLFISDDGGENWDTFAGFPQSLTLANYLTIRDSLIATVNSTIYWIQLEGTNLSIESLVNEGLEGHEITSICDFQDSTYVSTYTGVFVRAKEDFFSIQEN